MGLRLGCEMFLLFIMLMLVFVAHGDDNQPKIFNVNQYGALADGHTDNSQAFLKAWREACEWNGKARVLVPEGEYMVGPMVFEGECKGKMGFMIKGVLKAPISNSMMFTNQWITFQYVDGLVVSGGAKGTIDGQGHVAWPYNDCHKNPNCKPLPVSMRFNFVKNSKVHHLRSVNSKNSHMLLYGCENVTFAKIRILAPRDSPNTDGINIGSSSHIRVLRSTIGTGDDCISLLSGSRNIHIKKVICGPGHGISVGSLGKYPNEEDVKGLIVKNCTFRNTTDALRIKTWASPLASKVFNITYEDIFVDNVGNPINIDQQYCPHPPCDQKVSSRVQISDVTFKNIWGTTNSNVAVSMKCSSSFPCEKIVLDNINIAYNGAQGAVSALCSNVKGVAYGHQSPPSCL